MSHPIMSTKPHADTPEAEHEDAVDALPTHLRKAKALANMLSAATHGHSFDLALLHPALEALYDILERAEASASELVHAAMAARLDSRSMHATAAKKTEIVQ